MKVGETMSRLALFSVLSLLLSAGVLLLAVVGCEEKEVPFIVDADEIIRCVSETAEARELLRTSGLINPDPYTVPFDSATFVDSLLGHSRGFEVSLVPLKILNANGDSVANDPDRIYADHGYLGRVRESVVRVEDRFTIQISRLYNDTTLLDTTVLILDRYAFFLKLGADSKPYVGWVLWGFNGIGAVAPPLGVTLKGSAGADFRGDLGLYPDLPRSISPAIPSVPYIRLTELDTVNQGSRLLITTYKAASQGLPTAQLISDYDNDGPFTRSMYRYDPVDYVDSLSYQTPAANPRLYNLVLIQALTEQSFPIRDGFVVPYRR